MNINDLDENQLRALVIRMNKRIKFLENSLNNWKEAVGRWKEKALKNQLSEDQFVSICLNLEDNKIIYRCLSSIDFEKDIREVERYYKRLTREELVNEFPELNEEVIRYSNLKVIRAIKKNNSWIIDVQEKALEEELDQSSYMVKCNLNSLYKEYIKHQEDGQISIKYIRPDLIKSDKI